MTRHRNPKSNRVRAGLAALAAIGIGVTATAAVFTDSADTTSTVTAGTVDMKFDTSGSTFASDTFSLPFSTKPNGLGTWSEVQTFKIKNAGTEPIEIAGTLSDVVDTGTLKNELVLGVTAAPGAGVTLGGSAVAAGFNDVVSAGSGLSVGAQGTLISGANDFRLAPGASTTLTVKLSPTEALTATGLSNDNQGKVLTFKLTLDASTY